MPKVARSTSPRVKSQAPLRGFESNMQPLIPIDRFEIFASGLDHPECCAFDRDGNLWAGGEAGRLYRKEATGKVTQIANLGGFCCGIALSPDDREVFVCISGIGIVRATKNGEHTVFATH